MSSNRSFFERLRRSNLLDRDELAHCDAQIAAGASLSSVVEQLVQRGCLTRWHVRQLESGRQAFFLRNYKLLGFLGSGGMGAVYKAEHLKLRRIVALKVMNRKAGDTQRAVARFKSEMQAAARLDHPHIVRVHDADNVGDLQFLVMEYVEGRTLAAWRQQHRPLSIAAACECIRQAALGLQHAHQRGLIHRDIKPSNLLVAEADGGPLIKILDLGLARLVGVQAGPDNQTGTGEVMGTPDYIAPEQAQDVKTVDIRADIYSLGCTLFELLTDRLPFECETPLETVIARMTRDAPEVRSLRADVPVELNRIVARMLARNPVDRFAIPADVAEVLRPFTADVNLMRPQADQPPSAAKPDDDKSAQPDDHAAAVAIRGVANRPIPIAGPSRDTEMEGFLDALRTRPGRKTERRSGKRSLGWLVAAAIVAACLVTTLAAYPLVRRSWDNVAEGKPRRSSPSEPNARGRRGSRPIPPGSSKDGAVQGDPKGPLRQESWSPLRHNRAITGVCFTQDGLITVTASKDRTVGWWHLENSEDARNNDLKDQHDVVYSALGCSRKAPLFGFGTDDGAVRLVLVPSNLKRQLHGHSAAITTISFDDAGTRMVSTCQDGKAILWDVAEEKPLHTLPGSLARITPDGTRLFTASDGRLAWWGARSGDRLDKSDDDGGQPTALAVSPDSRRLAVARPKALTVIQIWDIKSQRKIAEWPLDHSEPISALAFSPDGGMLAAGNGKGVLRLRTVPAGGLRASWQERFEINSVVFHPFSNSINVGLAAVGVDRDRRGRGAVITLTSMPEKPRHGG